MKTRGLIFGLFVSASFLAPISSPPKGSPAERRSEMLSTSWQVPNVVRPLLDRACWDCHSNETRWPWTSRIPVAAWLIQRDVKRGREHLNFSTWIGNRPHLATRNEIQEICDAVSDESMPPRTYRLMHHNAGLSDAEKDTFCDWADQTQGAGATSVTETP